MARECELLQECGLFKKYQAANDLACKGFIKVYCQGPKMAECKRVEYYLEHGMLPSDDMLPSGTMIFERIRKHQPTLTAQKR
jgi:major membrane immunogen (membrane-anchored lipoprotein)